MSSATEIANLALALMRSNLEITSLTTEQTQVARLLRRVYPIKQSELLISHGWNFAKSRATLNVLNQNPNPVWAFEYGLPGDFLYPRRILGVNASSIGQLSANAPSNALVELGNLWAPQEDSNTNTIRFEIAQSSASPTVLSLYTNQMNAILEYTQNATSEGLYPPKFTLALAASIAAYIAPTLSNGDPYNIGQKLEAQAAKTKAEAMAEDMNGRMRFPADAEAIRVRGGSWW